MAGVTCTTTRVGCLLFASIFLFSVGLTVHAHGGGGRKASDKWAENAFESVQKPVQQSAHSFLHDRNKSPLMLPLDVNVVLVGFSGDGGYGFTVDAEKLRSFLMLSSLQYRPSCIETGKELEIIHQLTYNVVHAGREHVARLEQAVKGALKPAGVEQSTAKEYPGRHMVYTVEATNVEPAFDALYESLFGAHSAHEGAGSGRSPPSALIITNFDKRRLQPGAKPSARAAAEAVGGIPERDTGAPDADFMYRYMYQGGGRTATWISAGRYAVVDLSAGPCVFGSKKSSPGSVAPSSLPHLYMVPDNIRNSPHQAALFQGHLSSVIVQAVQHLFAPDIRIQTLDFAHRVLVPIMVLRNHHDFNPLTPGHEFSVDLAAVEKEVRKMVHPGQEVAVVAGVHSLHEHEHLATAIAKAQQSHSVLEPVGIGRYTVGTAPYLDGKIILEELRTSADMLASGLIGISHPILAKTFFNPQLPVAEQGPPVQAPGGLEQPTPGAYAADGKEPKKDKDKKHPQYTKSHGTRVIPVYLISIAGTSPELLLNGDSLVETSNDAVVVLQTTAGNVPIGYHSENVTRFAIPSAPTRHIIAGVASVLGGLVAPYERINPMRRQVHESWMWSTGHHPFGPFSNTTGVSLLIADTVQRNAIVSRIDTALRGVRKALEEVEKFATEHLSTPFGDRRDILLASAGETRGAGGGWPDVLYRDGEQSAVALPQAVVERLQRVLMDLEEQFVKLGGLLYSHQLAAAHELSSSVLVAVRGFHQYVEQELAAAREGIKCCKTEYVHASTSRQAFYYAGILAAGLSVYFLVIFFSSPER
eukprot:jgi/Mesvir1/18469/Mv14320-RA.1